MQKEIKNETGIIDGNGFLQLAGWSRKPLLRFDKYLCRNRLFLHERDSYVISDDNVTVFLSISEKGINAQIDALIFDRQNGTIEKKSLKKYMSFGSLDMPSSSKNGDTTFSSPRVGMNFSNTALKRYIRTEFVNLSKDKNLYINLTLEEDIPESFNVVIPDKDSRKGFFLRRFAPSMKVSGVVRLGGAEYILTSDNAKAFLDWQRYFTKSKCYYHALYADSKINGENFSLCLAGGFGDVKGVSDNCYFYKGEVFKLSQVKAYGTEEKTHKPWRFTESESGLDITFKPMLKGGHLMTETVGEKTFIFGSIYGKLNHSPSEIMEIDAMPAHLEFTVL